MKPPENMHTLRAIAVMQHGLEWMPMGLMVAVAWFGNWIPLAANDAKYQQ